MKPICILGAIIRRSDGYGFTIIFKTTEEAQRYKDMTKWIIESDKYVVLNKRGYHDDLL